MRATSFLLMVALVFFVAGEVEAGEGDRYRRGSVACDGPGARFSGARSGVTVGWHDGRWAVGMSVGHRSGRLHHRSPPFARPHGRHDCGRHPGHCPPSPPRHHRPPHDFYHHPITRSPGVIVIRRDRHDRYERYRRPPVVIDRTRPRADDVSNRDPWRALADGAAGVALAAFSREAVANPDDGLARVGYALAALDAGDGRRAAWAMRRALEANPEALLFAPVGEAIDTRIARRLRVIDTRIDEPDAMLLSAALHVLRHEPESALAALRRLRDVGDESREVIVALAEAIAEVG